MLRWAVAFCMQTLLQEVSAQAGGGKWSLTGSIAAAPPPGRACARQAVFRVADAGSRTLLAGVGLSNNLKVRDVVL